MRIVSLCDFSGAWSGPYKDAGYDVICVDIKNGHDVRLIECGDFEHVHGILAAPPCTHFSSSGARWWEQKGEGPLLDGLAIVDACLRLIAIARPKWWALENPVGRLSRFLGPPAFSFDPCDYGDPYTKRTHLWGHFCPPLPLFVGDDRSVPASEGSKMHLNYGGKSERTKTLRSTTPAGFAGAFFEVNP